VGCSNNGKFFVKSLTNDQRASHIRINEIKLEEKCRHFAEDHDTVKRVEVIARESNVCLLNERICQQHLPCLLRYFLQTHEVSISVLNHIKERVYPNVRDVLKPDVVRQNSAKARAISCKSLIDGKTRFYVGRVEKCWSFAVEAL